MAAEIITNIKFVKEVEKHPCLYNFKLPDYLRKHVTEKAWRDIGKKFRLSGPQCKEKWKNLRSVFVRNLKPNKSGSQRKPYYLADYMQFAIPFIKILGKVTDLPEAIQEASFNDEGSSLLYERTQSIPTQFADICSPTTSPPIIKQEGEPSHSPITFQPIIKDEMSLSSTCPESITQQLPSPSSATQSQSRQINNKTRKPSQGTQHNSSNIKKKRTRLIKKSDDQGNSNKMFLLSLLSDMNKMNDKQRRSFKRRVLAVVDKVMEQSNDMFASSDDSTD